MRQHYLWTSICLLFVSTAAFACSISYPDGYFPPGGRSLYTLPGTFFAAELKIIFDMDSSLEHTGPENGLKQTIEADIADLSAALIDDPDAVKKIADYVALRTAITDYIRFYKVYEQPNPYANEGEPPARPPFNLSAHEVILDAVPKEFSLYIQGAAAYHAGMWQDAVSSFSSILELAPEQRFYRSVWAAFMLGRAFLALEEPGRAVSFFEKTRTLVAEGYQDTLGLTGPSLSWQGRAHYLDKEYIQALRIYLEHGAYYDFKRLSITSINLVLRKICGEPSLYEEIAQDDMMRMLFTLWMYCRIFDRHKANLWLDSNTPLLSGNGVRGAEWFAALAYQIGEMDKATQWLTIAPADAFQTQLVRAKLLMRDGNLEDGIKILNNLAQSDHDSRRQLYTSDWNFPVPALHYFTADLAGGFLRTDHYAEALRALLMADQWGDAAFVAERLMTIPELEVFISQSKNDHEFLDALRQLRRSGSSKGEYLRHMIHLRHLLARRLARAGDWRAAAPFYPDNHEVTYVNLRHYARMAPDLSGLALQIAEHLEKAENMHLATRERAVHYFEAAQIIHQDGLYLMGAELYPDGAIRSGLFAFRPSTMSPDIESVFTEKAAMRFKESAIEPNKRFHYRYVAAALMWQCASLLPNNDPFTAEALYLGGRYLQHRDPEGADPFYKALVRRNPNLLIAKQADELRWFPKEFTDVVLYSPRPKQQLPRKRTLALYTAAVTALVFGALAGVWVARRIAKDSVAYRNS